jgi:nicotinamide phosphoribosyltransferase
MNQVNNIAINIITGNLLGNLVLNGDSYKYSHWVQYPKDTAALFSYIEARGTTTGSKGTLFTGLQPFIKQYLSVPITHADVDIAKAIIEAHGEPFNEAGWRRIVDVHNGFMPLRIRAVKEGTFVPVSNVLVTCESTDEELVWVESFFETSILRAVWYATTVATNSFHCKRIIMKALNKSSDNPEVEVNFKLHDFGARGVSSLESAAIGGAAHLINFMGTDTISGILHAMTYYDADYKTTGFSIPAAEHSTITSWGRENEFAAYDNMVEQYAKPGAMFAVVSDSYDIFKAVEDHWIDGGLIAKTKERGATVVIRPDSGDPTRVPVQIIELLCNKYGFTMNSKGYKVLPPEVRVIQGDGITPRTLETILENLLMNGYSASNLAFGMGGGLLQMVNRDTYKFAMKCSAAKVEGKWIDVYKDPAGGNKLSKKGRLTLVQNTKTGEFRTERNDGEGFVSIGPDWVDVMQTVYDNRPIESAYMTFDEVRAEANKYL